MKAMRLTQTEQVAFVMVLFIIGINLHKNAADQGTDEAGTNDSDPDGDQNRLPSTSTSLHSTSPPFLTLWQKENQKTSFSLFFHIT